MILFKRRSATYRRSEITRQPSLSFNGKGGVFTKRRRSPTLWSFIQYDLHRSVTSHVHQAGNTDTDKPCSHRYQCQPKYSGRDNPSSNWRYGHMFTFGSGAITPSGPPSASLLSARTMSIPSMHRTKTSESAISAKCDLNARTPGITLNTYICTLWAYRTHILYFNRLSISVKKHTKRCVKITRHS